MPIAKELRGFYGAEWRERIRPRILARAGGRCEWCRKGPDRQKIIVVRDGTGRWLDTPSGLIWRDGHGEPATWPRGTKSYRIRLILTVAHLDHSHDNNDDANLAALCQRCHLMHDREQHRESFLRRRDDRSGQRQLFSSSPSAVLSA